MAYYYSHKDKSKNYNQQVHFERRCQERLGVSLSANKIIKMIRNGDMVFLGRESNRISKFLYHYNKKDYIIIYDKIRHNPVTIYEDSNWYKKI